MFLGDISILQNRSFPKGSTIDLNLVFRNVGLEDWPSDASLNFVDGHIMTNQDSIPLYASPGEDCRIPLRLRTPDDAGTYMGSWRLACSAGYFGDAIYLIVAVNDDTNDDLMITNEAITSSNWNAPQNISQNQGTVAFNQFQDLSQNQQQDTEMSDL